MPNKFKLNPTGSEDNSLFKGNWAIDTSPNNTGGGPSVTTGFYNGAEIPASGWAVYTPAGTVFNAATSTQLLEYVASLNGNASSVNNAISWLSTNNYVILRSDFEPTVTRGLVMYLDAGHLTSYPGSGTTISDLILGNNGTVISNSTFSTNNSGIIVYGSSQNSGVITLPPISAGLNLSNETYMFWAKCLIDRSTTTGGSFNNWIIHYGNYFGNNSGGFGLQSGTIRSYLKGSTSSGWSSTSSSSVGNSIYDTYDWIFYTLQIENSNNIKFYMNNTLVFDRNISDSYTQHGSNTIVLGRNMDMIFSNIQIYNRALTPEEIQQNYNALKGRFNL